MADDIREAVYKALLAKLELLKTEAGVVTVSRNWRGPLEVPGKYPAVFLVASGERHVQEHGVPELRHLDALVLIYVDKGNARDKIAQTEINLILEQLDAHTFLPDPMSGVCDLDGLVAHAWRTGTTSILEGPAETVSVIAAPCEVTLKGDTQVKQLQYWFDEGDLYLIPTSVHAGAEPVDPTPVKMVSFRECALNFETEFNYPTTGLTYKVDAYVASVTARARARFANIDGRVLGQIVLGHNATTGARLLEPAARLSIPADPVEGKYLITVVPPSSGTWTEDLGVCLADGTPLVRVTAGEGEPGAGEYTVAAGVYEFNAAQAAAAVRLSYLYSVASGLTVTLDNVYQASAPRFRAVLSGSYNGKRTTLVLENCISRQLAFPIQFERFVIMDFEFEALAGSGNLGTFNISG